MTLTFVHKKLRLTYLNAYILKLLKNIIIPLFIHQGHGKQLRNSYFKASYLKMAGVEAFNLALTLLVDLYVYRKRGQWNGGLIRWTGMRRDLKGN